LIADPGSFALLIATGSLAISIATLARTLATKKTLTAAMCPCGHGINFHEAARASSVSR
jgi:hypothetical protein